MVRRNSDAADETMTGDVNSLGQPIGDAVAGWTARPRPPRRPMAGRFSRVEPFDPERHASELYIANSEDADGRMWTYLPHGPYARFEDYLARMTTASAGDDPLVHAIIDLIVGLTAGKIALIRRIVPRRISLQILRWRPLCRRPAL